MTFGFAYFALNHSYIQHHQMKWDYKPSPNQETTNELSKVLNINTDLASILVQRGVTTFDEAKDFFRPSLEHLHDPFLMKGMTEAVNTLSEALSANEKILIYGDYDVDGCTSVGLTFGFLSAIHQNIEYYIPDRFNEGYGVSEKAVEYIKNSNFDLVITLDCGITAINEVNSLIDHDIKVIVCDHHLPEKELPRSIILNPKQKNCNYPFKELCGVGVGFKLLQGFCLQQSIPLENLFKRLDFVAVGTCADIVSMTGENRILTHYGINVLNQDPSVGFKALMNLIGKAQIESVSDIVFFLAPRINACGRIAKATQALELLIEKDFSRAQEKAHNIEQINLERKELDALTTEQALALLEEDKPATVIYHPNWHKGVIGIVASRCIEASFKPTVVLTKENDDLISGSVRTVGQFDVHKALNACKEHLTQFGGHKAAAGVTLTKEQLPAFKSAFEKYVQENLKPEDLEPCISIDLDIPLSRINMKFLNILGQMAPFGPDNMTPVFSSKAVEKGAGTKVVGKEMNHLKVQVSQNKELRDGIAFGKADLLKVMDENDNFDIAYSLDINNFNGNKSPQLTIKDIKQ